MDKLVLFLTLAAILTVIPAKTRMIEVNSIGSEEELEETPPQVNFGATRMKNKVRGPADIGVYYINAPGVSCGGLSTSQCSKSCGALGYPVYWCYPKVCYCHYG